MNHSHLSSPPDSVWEDPRITAYVLDELPADERQAFEQEISANRSLAAAVEEARQIVGDVSALYAAEAKPTLSDEHRAALHSATVGDAAAKASVPAGAAVSTLPTRGRYTLSRASLAIAASATFLAGLGSGLLWPALREARVDSYSYVAMDSPRADRSVSTAPSSLDAMASSDESGGAVSSSEEARGITALPAEKEEAAPSQQLAQVPPPSIGPAAAPADAPPASSQPPAERRAEMTYADMEGMGGYGRKEMQRGQYGAEMYGGYGSPEIAGYSSGKMDAARPDLRGMGEMGYGSEMGHSVQAGGDGSAQVPGARREMDAASATAEKQQVTGERFRQSTVAPERVAVPEAIIAARTETLPSSHPYSITPIPNTMTDEGRGPGMAGDQFSPITDNAFRRVEEHPLSTFSIDVDTASYAKVRSFLMQQGSLPRPDAVRIEELINYFDYDYAPPAAEEGEDAASEDSAPPFASHVELAGCPWQPEHRLARIGIKGKEIAREDRPAGNFVFLLDVSGSMNQPNKLPLLKQGMKLLLEQLNERDRIAIVVYAGAAGLVLDSTPGDRAADVRDALDRLRAGGSTNGGDGIQLAYNVARDHFIDGGVNRVILCTDGDFNVGTTGTDSLVRMIEKEAKGGVFLSVLGFGMGNHNDAMLEQISGRGNGNYAFIDSLDEAHKVLVEQAAGTLVTIAKDVKIQVEFNPTQVAAYRLIGYENRILAKEDFNDDTKDAGEIGAGHTVTALYEVVPAGKQAEPIAPEVDSLRYQIPSRPTEAAETGEMLTVKLRFKAPDGEKSRLLQFPASDEGVDFAAASRDYRFAASVAGFGMLLRNSPYQGDWSFADVEQAAAGAVGEETSHRREEFLQMVRKAAELSGR